MNYFSICSGIECAGVAWHPLGFKPLGFCEIDPFRSAVLSYHYPEVKNYGDFTKVQKKDIAGISPDVLVGGTPCATFSIAGFRKGISEDRGNLALEFIRLVERLNPTWVVWENVPGILSSNKGKDFATFLGSLAELRYGFSYRVLDTQFIRTQRFPNAIPQMRRRVFVVGHIRDWKRTAEVLFDRKILSWNTPPSKEKKQTTSQKSDSSPQKCDTPKEKDLIIIHGNFSRVNGDGFRKDGATYTLTATEIPSIYQDSIVRRLTPLECERLQGLPDNYTQIPYKGKSKEDCSISKRYEACGRGMSVNVMDFLGNKIKEVHNKYDL